MDPITRSRQDFRGWCWMWSFIFVKNPIRPRQKLKICPRLSSKQSKGRKILDTGWTFSYVYRVERGANLFHGNNEMKYL